MSGTSRVAVAACVLLVGQASAHERHHRLRSPIIHGRYHLALATWTPRASAPVIQCVAFAKRDAGIEITGNARDWWGNAAGVYQRGNRPEGGSVLSFLANVRMPLGHVAVVSGIQDSRTITIDQSHWNSRGITRDIEVKDVSENNDWTAVRVQLSRGGDYGAIYPTHGFIYPRQDEGRMVANVTRAPMPRLDRAPADLRRRRNMPSVVEVAEAPDDRRPLDLTVPGISFDAPSRALR